MSSCTPPTTGARSPRRSARRAARPPTPTTSTPSGPASSNERPRIARTPAGRARRGVRRLGPPGLVGRAVLVRTASGRHPHRARIGTYLFPPGIDAGGVRRAEPPALPGSPLSLAACFGLHRLVQHWPRWPSPVRTADLLGRKGTTCKQVHAGKIGGSGSPPPAARLGGRGPLVRCAARSVSGARLPAYGET